VGQVADTLLTGLQQLLQESEAKAQPHPQQQQQQQQVEARWSGLGVDADLLDQMLAVMGVVLAVAMHAFDGVRSEAAAAALESVTAVVKLLLTATAVHIAHQVAAVQLLVPLLQQQQLQQHHPMATDHEQSSLIEPSGGTSAGSSPTAVQAQVVAVLRVAAASASADVRAAAVEAANIGAKSALQCLQGARQQADNAAASHTFIQLARLLASRLEDVDAPVAAAARASFAHLTLPLYLLNLSARGRGSALPSAAAGDSSSADSALQGAAAGLGGKWKRLAALQPQQRAFKAAHLAQLFDTAYHASPAMLQRQLLRAAQQQLPQPQAKHAAQGAALYRLAQALPLLPAAAGSSGSGSLLRFEDLSSAAVASWLLSQEAARQCVSSRMRTHLGNPTQSFGSLERVVQILLQQLQGDESHQGQQRAWQRQLLQLLQAAVPQQQLQQQAQQTGSGQQHEPQQLLQAPGAAAGTAGAHAALQRRPHQHHQQQHSAKGAAAVEGADPAAAAEAAQQMRSESEAAVGSLLDFMYALEVNIQAATEGSMMRPAVSKSVMAFFAGNKKVSSTHALMSPYMTAQLFASPLLRPYLAIIRAWYASCTCAASVACTVYRRQHLSFLC
jgi:hypothetical protein